VYIVLYFKNYALEYYWKKRRQRI